MTNTVTLTDEQRNLVELEDGPYLVTAPPGSGKTEVLIQRILHLLRRSQGASFRILALTFTTKAAEILTRRIHEDLVDDAWRVTSSTFHSFCLDILKHYGEPVGIAGEELSIYENNDDRLQVLTTALFDEGYAIPAASDHRDPLKEVLSRIDRLRRDLVLPNDLPGEEELWRIRLRDAYAGYERVMERYRAIDFDGMLVRAHQLLTGYPRIAHHYRRIYKYIMIDEAQDTNHAQYEILRALCGDDHVNVFMVADQNQSMYGFAGASTHYLDRFVDEYHASRKELTHNFRCAQEIVKAANALIAHSPRALKDIRAMHPAVGAPGKILAWHFQTEKAEAEGLLNWIRDLLEQGLDPSWLLEVERQESSVRPEDICILARSRNALRAVIEELELRDSDFQFRASERDSFDSSLHRILHCGLRLLANPRDLPGRHRLGRLLGAEEAVCKQMERDDPVALMRRIAEARSSGGPEISHVLSEAVRQDWALDELVAQILELDPKIDEEEQVILWETDQEFLRRSWEQYRGKIPADQRFLPGFLGQLSMARRDSLAGPGIRVLTVHAAKGLGFPVVALVGMNDGVFPDFRSLDDENSIDDERRNAYVAITRAERVLWMSRPRTRLTRYGPREQTPSRFIDEMHVEVQPCRRSGVQGS